MEQAVQHYCQKLLQEALTRWKVHHQGCVRKRVRQRATPRAPQRGQAVWAGRPRSGEERSSLKRSQQPVWMVVAGVLQAQGCLSGC